MPEIMQALHYAPPEGFPDEELICTEHENGRKTCGIFFPAPLDDYLASFGKQCLVRTSFMAAEIVRLERVQEVQQEYLATTETRLPWYIHAAAWGAAGLMVGMGGAAMVSAASR